MNDLKDIQKTVRDLETKCQNFGFISQGVEKENQELSYEIRCLKDELDISKKREDIAVACLCRLREQGNEDAIQTLEELLVK